jgi:hypothetical protein
MKKGAFRIVLKKLLAGAVVVLIAALLATPALAIESSAGDLKADTNSPTGPFTAADCPTLQQDPVGWEINVSMFPGLTELCP